MADKINDAFWFEHVNGDRLYPWWRARGRNGHAAFWISDGSNLIGDAEPVENIEELVVQVFRHRRHVWLRANGAKGGSQPRSGLYRVGQRAFRGWGAKPAIRLLIESGLSSYPTIVDTRVIAPTADDLTVQDYRIALDSARLTEAQRAWLMAHALRPDGCATMRELSADVGHADWETANLLYGKVAGRIAEQLPRPPALLGTRKPVGRMQWIAQGMGRNAGSEFVWRLLPQIRAALSLDDELETSEGSSVDDTEEEFECALRALMSTEREAIVRARVGQDLFRRNVLKLWGGRCAVTGLALPQLLRASHAKPWNLANPRERLDPFNGFLLAANLDALFDAFLLSFDDRGRALWAPGITTDVRQTMGLGTTNLGVRTIDARHLPYLRWHRGRMRDARAGDETRIADAKLDPRARPVGEIESAD